MPRQLHPIAPLLVLAWDVYHRLHLDGYAHELYHLTLWDHSIRSYHVIRIPRRRMNHNHVTTRMTRSST